MIDRDRSSALFSSGIMLGAHIAAGGAFTSTKEQPHDNCNRFFWPEGRFQQE